MIRISSILLAAGESKRMGKQKLLLNLGKSNIINITLENLLKSEIFEMKQKKLKIRYQHKIKESNLFLTKILKKE
jgi:CTP:molybdopterin cytidylyltransferase MocA